MQQSMLSATFLSGWLGFLEPTHKPVTLPCLPASKRQAASIEIAIQLEPIGFFHDDLAGVHNGLIVPLNIQSFALSFACMHQGYACQRLTAD